MARNLYEILGVAKTATQDQIKNAFRAIAKKQHPDLNPGNKEAERKFKEANQAYELLGDPATRAKFDRGEIGADGQEDGRRGQFYHQTQEGGGRYSQSFGEGVEDDM